MKEADFLILMEKYVANELSKAEFEQLWNAAREPGHRATWTKFMHRMWEEAGHGEQDALLKAEMLQQIQNAPEDARRKSRIRRLSWWAAAACVAGLSTAFCMLKQDKAPAPIVESRPANAASSEIRPGRQQAMLTLADGTVLELDSASNGLLGQQGKTRVTKLANGQLAYQQQGESTQPLYNTMRTPRGGQYQVLLPDGTKAWLNAASSLTYPVAFLKNERRVKVTGEVYFEVAAGNPHAPFIVEVTGMREQPDFEVKVLGTTFNINAYEDEGPAEATLLSGAVVLAREGVQVGLRPGEQAVMGTTIQQRRPEDIEQVIAWKDGYFKFTQADVGAVMRQAARWYDVSVVYPNGVPPDVFSGTLPRNVSLEKFLQILVYSDIKATIKDRQVIIVQ